MTRVPGGTETGTPSIVRLIKPSAISRLPSANHDGLAFACEIGFKLPAEFLDTAHDRRGARIRQHTDRLARHVLGKIEQQIEILGFALSREDPLHDLRGPRGAFATLRALRARLMRIEL